MRKFALYVVPAIGALLAVSVARAQRGVDWMTDGYDAQRSSWVRSDGKISLASMRKPGFSLLWKLKFENTARELNTLTPPALLDFYIGYRGFRSFAFIGMSSDRVVGVDVDLARIDWDKTLGSAAAPAGTLPCPGGMTSSVTRPTGIAYPPFFVARGAGRANPAKSAVGAPDAGAVTIKPVTAAAPRPARPVRRPANTVADEANPYAPRVQWVLALTGDGKLHSLYASNGDEPNPPVQFLPPNAHAVGLISYGNVVYTATTNGCGGVDNGIWALDLATKKISKWKSASGGVAGSAGPAVRPDGTLFVAAGSELSALAPKTLKPLASYEAEGAEFTSSPVVFQYKGKDLIAVASNDGRVHLLDSGGLNKPLDKTAPTSTPDYAVGALSSWQDPAGVRWIFVPSGSAIAAWKVVEKDGALACQAGWTSRALVSPLAPVVVNGVMFVLSTGEFRSHDAALDAAARAQRSTNAVLYALDPVDGKELWSSGNTITSFVHSGGLSAGGGRVYVAGYNGTEYAFGFPMEH
jgi:outer membrane protein assembly factor BamB